MFGLIPLLFAAPSHLSPANQLVVEVRKLYKDLDAANLSRQYTDTIKFSFVSPPSETHTNSWRCESQQESQRFSMDDDDVFGQIASTHGSSKPLALYLPGLDGVGISATAQFDDLAETFELWRMSVSSDDRSSFTGLTETVSSFIRDAAVKSNRDIVLIGESFGGLLAPAVAMRARAQQSRRVEENTGLELKDPIKGLVLVNPATSFDDTQWSTFVPLLAQLKHLRDENDSRRPPNLPTPYSLVGGLALATTIPDMTQLRRIVSMLTNVPVTNPDDLTDVLESMVAGFGILDSNLPPSVIEHRVGQWLSVGTSVVNPRMAALNVPTLVIAGQDDNMLPTKKEAERLVKIMPKCEKLDIQGSGHFVLDERVNLTKAICESHIDPLNKKSEPPYDPITDWTLPPDEVIKDTLENRVKPLRNLVSPVFFSTGPDGRRRMGLSHLPGEDEGPLLFVANHQFGGIDLGLIIGQLIEDRGIKARGLAHPVIFAAGSGETPFAGGGPPPGQQAPGGGDPNKDGLFQQFGAVKVTPRNYYRLMQSGQSALLFPGGVREVFHGKDEAYTLFWPEKVDFVRIAAKFNATVIPLSAIGAADSVNILIDAPDMLTLPFGIGENVANNSANVVSARYDAEDSAELFQPPFALPKPLPARHYFVFGQPTRTHHVDHKNKDACQKIYEDIQKEMQRGFDDLLRARDKDPFAGTAKRIAYEQVTGKIAPTFSLSALH